jgi:site-specific recombinase XerD
MNTENESDIKRFLDIKMVNGQSRQTIVNQKRILDQFGNYLGDKTFKDAAEQDVMEFLAHKKEKVNDVTMQSFKIVIKLFYRFLYGLKRGEYPLQVVNVDNGNHTKSRSPIRPEDIITKEDVAFLIKHCRNFRDEAMLVALYESGCRISEFANLNIGHLLFDEKGLVMLVNGKTGERRIRLIESVPYVEKWLENHPLRNDKSAPLWVTLKESYRHEGKKNVRLKTYTIAWILGKIKQDSKFSKPLNPHALRHSRLTELSKFLSDGKLKVFAGWTGSSSMAGIYVHLGGKDLDDDLLQIAGVEVRDEKKESPLKAKECTRCHTKNQGTAEFCMLCGKPFNESLVVEETLDSQQLKNEVETLKEQLQKTEGVGSYLDKLVGQIEKLQQQVNELKGQNQ